MAEMDLLMDTEAVHVMVGILGMAETEAEKGVSPLEMLVVTGVMMIERRMIVEVMTTVEAMLWTPGTGAGFVSSNVGRCLFRSYLIVESPPLKNIIVIWTRWDCHHYCSTILRSVLDEALHLGGIMMTVEELHKIFDVLTEAMRHVD